MSVKQSFKEDEILNNQDRFSENMEEEDNEEQFIELDVK